jgi:hypothetical protein
VRPTFANGSAPVVPFRGWNKRGANMIRLLLRSDLKRIKEIDSLVFSADDQYDEAVYDEMLHSGLSVVAADGDGVVGFLHGLLVGLGYGSNELFVPDGSELIAFKGS